MAAPLIAIRLLGRIVAVLTGAAAVVYAATAVTGPTVLWLVDSSTYQVSGFVSLPLPLRVAHALAFVLGASTIAVIALLVADLARRIHKEPAFASDVSRAAWSLALVLAIGAWLAQIASNVAARAGLIYPDGVDLSFVRLDDLPIDWAVNSATFMPDLRMLGLGIAFALLAIIIRSGEGLQRDVEGLV